MFHWTGGGGGLPKIVGESRLSCFFVCFFELIIAHLRGARPLSGGGGKLPPALKKTCEIVFGVFCR